ncbi:MAG: F0F1 ATP synthase subunit B [Elusimicrobia bacterium]|nr:F0F1 ATP synthase subunit B [Elusimicrobiota bacterium]
MEHGASTNTGLWVLVFNVISFITVLGILGKFGWPAIVKALKDREEHIRKDLAAAEKARLDADSNRRDLEKKMADLEQRTAELVAQAKARGEELQSGILKEAQAQASAILEQSRQQLDKERARLLQEVRGQIGELTVLATERILRHSADPRVHRQYVEELLQEIERSPAAQGKRG